MITIHFSQCCDLPCPDHADNYGVSRAVNLRCAWWESLLQRLHKLDGNQAVYTYDEHVLLIAQWLFRHGKIPKPEFVQHCGCVPGARVIGLYLDDEGDFTDDMRHGFFTQRTPYLFS